MNFQGRRKEVVCCTNLLMFLLFGQWSGAISNISDGAGLTGSVQVGLALGQRSSQQTGASTSSCPGSAAPLLPQLQLPARPHSRKEPPPPAACLSGHWKFCRPR